MTKGEGNIRGSLVYLGVLALMAIGFLIPVGIEWIAPFIGVAFFLKLKKQGRIKTFDWKEVLLMTAYTIILFGGLIYSQALALASVPWLKIILVGMAADVFGTILSSVPIVGDFVSGLLNFILVFVLIGGIQGAMIGMVIGMITIIPGPSLGANTLFLIIFKIASETLFSGLS